MVERTLPKPDTRVRFPSAARYRSGLTEVIPAPLECSCTRTRCFHPVSRSVNDHHQMVVSSLTHGNRTRGPSLARSADSGPFLLPRTLGKGPLIPSPGPENHAEKLNQEHQSKPSRRLPPKVHGMNCPLRAIPPQTSMHWPAGKSSRSTQTSAAQISCSPWPSLSVISAADGAD